ASIFSPQIAIIYTVIQYLISAPFTGWQLLHASAPTLAIIAALLMSEKHRDKPLFYPLIFYYALFFIVILSAEACINGCTIHLYFRNLIYGLIMGFISVVAAQAFSPTLERRVRKATRQVLLDLIDTNHPLLKKLAEKAPGTYSHSLIVGNLAESAADAIGANSLLARVGSYYHDIGKIDTPAEFIENDEEAAYRHDQREPEESALMIREHVQRGITTAKRNHIPPAVVDIIKQHHGTSFIKYFYDKALKSGEQIDHEKFKYFGPRPQTKEAALVMIADIVESTAKSLRDFSVDSLQRVLDKTINNLIVEKQLLEAPITLRELETIKAYMLPILKGVYNKRIEYPEDSVQTDTL
ncbi:MAG: HDIG domain-containing protein, partial [Candidatus Cloacimonetes bacterium]|nr:HDIG domain-containing protein [Candidatus Cloacimonadota bacterium]